VCSCKMFPDVEATSAATTTTTVIAAATNKA
jgi:hypothetical protein